MKVVKVWAGDCKMVGTVVEGAEAVEMSLTERCADRRTAVEYENSRPSATKVAGQAMSERETKSPVSLHWMENILPRWLFRWGVAALHFAVS